MYREIQRNGPCSGAKNCEATYLPVGQVAGKASLTGLRFPSSTSDREKRKSSGASSFVDSRGKLQTRLKLAEKLAVKLAEVEPKE